ncbi:MAG: Stk1 family PASTA domain-containing Ser/Thr kinase [Oscillospiraceae bacterium]|nr:Stk1 family PASTA domain-containing Ser/Thr kinase [Oscillospiraceae bacterium]
MEKDRNDKNIGKKLDGRYEITELIGEGGMADVYRATDVVDNKTVAVKILKKEFAENEEFLRRFRNESKAIAVLSHPNIVKVFDVGFSERIQFIVMEYIDGITLNEYMQQQGQLGWKDAVHFILQILRALQHAHSKGIVHRDIKPQNIMMLRDGTIKVMDFGIAKFAREDGKTGTDKAIGTVHYISPEQARGGATDAKSDLYSVGVMLYEMLTGKKPFDTDNPVSIAVMHMQAKVPLPHTVRPDLQIGLEEIILKAMEKDPANRYQSARDMMDDLQTFKENPDGVFGYYPELFGSVQEELPPQGADAVPQFYDPAYDPADDMQRGYPEEDDGYYDEPDDGYYDDPQDDYYGGEDDDVYYDDEEDDEDEDDEDEYEESRSLFVPILSAVIIVVIVVAAVLFTSVMSKMLRNDDNANTAEEKLMPSLIGMDYQEATLTYGDMIDIEIISSEFSSYEKDKIFDQDIKANDPVKKGQRVNVKVSLGARKVTIQDMTGWDYETAKNQILTLGLQVDPRTTYDAEVEEGKVIKTDPAGPCELTPGDYVQVVISRGKNAVNVIVPTFIGMQWDLARTMAEGNDLVVGKEDVDDSSPEGTVLGQNVNPGEEVSEGTPIMLKVSTGKAKEQSVSVTFAVPSSATGLFRIVLYEDGAEKASSSQFNPEYALGSTRLTVSGTGTHDMIAMLFNEATGSEARIGTYRIEFDAGTYTPLSYDINGAFEHVGGLKTTTPPASTTTGGSTTSSTSSSTTTSTTATTPQQTEPTDEPEEG